MQSNLWSVADWEFVRQSPKTTGGLNLQAGFQALWLIDRLKLQSVSSTCQYVLNVFDFITLFDQTRPVWSCLSLSENWNLTAMLTTASRGLSQRPNKTTTCRLFHMVYIRTESHTFTSETSQLFYSSTESITHVVIIGEVAALAWAPDYSIS